jgi:hypothetical protein
MLITKQKDVWEVPILSSSPHPNVVFIIDPIAPCLMQHLLSSVHPGLARLLLSIVLDNIQSSQSSNTTTIAISPLMYIDA